MGSPPRRQIAIASTEQICPGMAEKRKTPWGRDKIFALDWLGLAEKRVLGDVLRLFALRCAWLKDGNSEAYLELVRAHRAADPDIRGAAELLLSEMAHAKQPIRSPADGSQGVVRTAQCVNRCPRPIAPPAQAQSIRLRESRASLQL